MTTYYTRLFKKNNYVGRDTHYSKIDHLSTTINGRMSCNVYMAIMSGRIDDVIMSMSNGFNLTSHDNYALRLAVMYGHIEIVRYLISLGANVDHPGGTPLHIAIATRNLRMIKCLLSFGANVKNIECHDMACIIIMNDTSILQLLIDYGANILEFINEINMYAFGDNTENMAKFFINRGICTDDVRMIKYISILDERHLSHITNKDIRRIILQKKRIYDYPADVVISFDQN